MHIHAERKASLIVGLNINFLKQLIDITFFGSFKCD